jgi:thiamine-phosphate pyrophosphorylase
VAAAHHLQLVTDRRAARGDLATAVARAIDAGVDSVQVRDKGASAAELFATVVELQRVARSSGVRVLVNDRIDVALATRAHGVHLAANSLPPAVARAVLEPWQLVGVSVHAVDEAVRAAADGADYLTFGHVFDTPSHAGEPARGAAMLAHVVAAVDVPVIAIGGITAARVGEVLATGCAGIALISAILSAADPAAAAAALRQAIDDAAFPPRRPFPERRD